MGSPASHSPRPPRAKAKRPFTWEALAVSVLLGWLVAGRALRGLQQITSAARSVSASRLD